MGWVIGIVLYLLCGLVCAVIAAKLEASDPGDSADGSVLVVVVFAWPMLLVIVAVAGSIMGIEKLILWLAEAIPDVKFTSKEK